MRSKDIRVGERYVARHRGATIVVTIDEIKQIPSPSWSITDAWRSVIKATNAANGQAMRFRSPISIVRPAERTVAEVNSIDDLFVDQKAWPEPGVRYRLRAIDHPRYLAEVDYIVRRDTELFAVADDGKEYGITGQGAFVLVPSGS